MDAAETDSDVKLQRVAGDLIRQFDAALGPLLRKKGRDGDLHMRDWVRVRDVSALTSNVTPTTSPGGGAGASSQTLVVSRR